MMILFDFKTANLGTFIGKSLLYILRNSSFSIALMRPLESLRGLSQSTKTKDREGGVFQMSTQVNKVQ